jgi:hypothetical protein
MQQTLVQPATSRLFCGLQPVYPLSVSLVVSYSSSRLEHCASLEGDKRNLYRRAKFFFNCVRNQNSFLFPGGVNSLASSQFYIRSAKITALL